MVHNNVGNRIKELRPDIKRIQKNETSAMAASISGMIKTSFLIYSYSLEILQVLSIIL